MEPDEDADYQLALRLSEELNSEQTPSIAGPSQQPNYEDEADFAYALQLQFGDENSAHQVEGKAPASRSGSSRKEDLPQQDASPWAPKADQSKTASYQPEAANAKNFNTLAAFLGHVKSAQCPGCGQAFFRSEQDVSTRLQAWKSAKSVLKSHLECTGCFTSSCVTCVPDLSAKWSVVSVQGKLISWCCAGGRLLLLWMLLCGFDEHFSAVRSNKAAICKPDEKPKVDKKVNKRGRGGIGFGGSSRGSIPAIVTMPSGMGYGSDVEEIASWGTGLTLSGHRFDAKATNTDSKARAITAQQTDDQFHELYLQLVESLLPSFERECIFDFDPPNSLAEMLLGSKVLNYCAELLRNDSLDDATKRKGVYQALLSLLRTLGAHYTTASAAIYNERPLREDKDNILVMSFHEFPKQSVEKTSSLLDSLRNLNTQSELVLQGAKSNEKEFRTYEGQNLLLLCRQISDLRAYLVTNSGTYGKPNFAQSKADIPALLDVPDDQVIASHAFGPTAQALRSAPSGRFKRLMTEITTLSTGLPPGLFVRYAESRPDVHKVVIIGPEGTPYANGIFEFDIFCDANFPNKPPLVQFKTTGGGRVNFNPNLYADGKVCLSLLGTWQGEPWVPGESTLLQVVISIQAFILCEEPWYNEPGREVSYGRSRTGQGPSASYNQQIRQHTVRTAMLEWLDKTPPLWKDVVDQHFTMSADKILHTSVEWSRSSVPTGHYRYGPFDDEMDDDVALSVLASGKSRWAPPSHEDLTSMLPRLQTALTKYGASQIVPNDPTSVSKTPTAAHATRSRPQLPLSQPLAQHNPHEAAQPYAPPPLPSYSSMTSFANPFTAPAPFNSYPMPGFATSFHAGNTYGGFGASSGFMGPGKTIGASQQPGTVAQTAGGRGRYETRSSTRGRGGFSLATSPIGSHGSTIGSTFGLGGNQRGESYAVPRGGFSQDRGRGGRGGRGDGIGRDGRGGSSGP